MQSTPRCSSTCRTLPLSSAENSTGLRQSPTRRSNIPGSRASLWLSRWRRLCAGPRKLRENPSLTRAPRPTAASQAVHSRVRKPHFANRIAQQDLPRHEAARPPRRPGPRKFLLPMLRIWAWNRPRARSQRLPRRRDQRDQEDRGSVRERRLGFALSLSGQPKRPAFSSLDDEPQTSDAGGSKKTLLIAVLVLGLAAAGYFGWTKMQSAHPQPAAQQSAVPASSGTAALPPQPSASVQRSQPATGEVVTQQPNRI